MLGITQICKSCLEAEYQSGRSSYVSPSIPCFYVSLLPNDEANCSDNIIYWIRHIPIHIELGLYIYRMLPVVRQWVIYIKLCKLGHLGISEPNWTESPTSHTDLVKKSVVCILLSPHSSFYSECQLNLQLKKILLIKFLRETFWFRLVHTSFLKILCWKIPSHFCPQVNVISFCCLIFVGTFLLCTFLKEKIHRRGKKNTLSITNVCKTFFIFKDLWII